MKKTLVAFLVCAGLLIALPALASDWNFNLSYTFGDASADQTGGLNESSDLSGFLIGLDYPADPWGIGFMFASGSLDDTIGGQDDFDLGDIWGAYRIAGGDSSQLNLVLDYATLQNGDYDINGPMVGLTGLAKLGGGWSLEGGFGFSLGAVSVSNSTEDLTDTSMSKLFAKANYEFSNNWGLGIGFYQYRYAGTAALGDLDGKTQLYTLGLTYRFGAVKEEPKVEEVKKEEPKEEPKVEEPVKEEPKEEPKVEEPVKEEPVVEEPKEEPKVEEPVKEEPKEEPKVEEPVVEEPVVETPVQKQERVARINEFLHPIFFDFDKYVIRVDQLPFLWQSLKVLQENPDLYILIAGHADPPGSDNYNKQLSERRAWRICDWLIANGIDGSRIMIVGYGEEYPFMAESNDPNWESDRWVDIVVSEEPLNQDAGIRK